MKEQKSILQRLATSNKGAGLALAFGAAVAGYNLFASDVLIAERDALKTMTPEQTYTTYKDFCVRRSAFNQVWEKAYNMEIGDTDREIAFPVSIHPQSIMTKNCTTTEHEAAIDRTSSALTVNIAAALLGFMLSMTALTQLARNARHTAKNKNNPQPKP